MPNPMRKRAVEGLREGDVFSFSRTFSREETMLFGDLTRDYNPVHYDARWTAEKGFKGLICHGLLVGAMICEFGGQVGWLATGMDFKFIKPVYFGDTITCRIELTALTRAGRAQATATFTNQDAIKVGHAVLTGRLPIDGERVLLDRMVTEGDPTNRLAEETYDQQHWRSNK